MRERVAAGVSPRTGEGLIDKPSPSHAFGAGPSLSRFAGEGPVSFGMLNDIQARAAGAAALGCRVAEFPLEERR